ncbi:MAG: hypothetical protein KDB14_18470 [Planctomycetales bacterium]|nr:hypothetical protein [Planctomycetales bacterium]
MRTWFCCGWLALVTIAGCGQQPDKPVGPPSQATLVRPGGPVGPPSQAPLVRPGGPVAVAPAPSGLPQAAATPATNAPVAATPAAPLGATNAPGAASPELLADLRFIPADALAVVVAHPHRAAASQPGRALATHPAFAKGFAGFPPWEDIERIVYSVSLPTPLPTALPTHGAVRDCTAVRLTKPLNRQAVLTDTFADEKYEATTHAGVEYFRLASFVSAPLAAPPTAPPAANPVRPNEQGQLLASYPDDHRPGSNGHPDGSDSGNWFYLRSNMRMPSLPEAETSQLHWVANRKRYESPRGEKGNTYPSIDRFLDPGPFSPRYVALRWQSRISGTVRITGRTHKFSNAKDSDGTELRILVDNQERFATKLKPRDTTGVSFDIHADIKPESRVEFVVDPLGHAKSDTTALQVTLELVNGAQPPAVAHNPQSEPAPAQESAGDAEVAVYFADDRTFVVAPEAALRQLLDGPANSPLAKHLQPSDFAHDLVVSSTWQGREQAAQSVLAKSLRGRLSRLAELPLLADRAMLAVNAEGEKLLQVTLHSRDAAAVTQLQAWVNHVGEVAGALVEALPDSPLASAARQLSADFTSAVRQDGDTIMIALRRPTDWDAALASLVTPGNGNAQPRRDPLAANEPSGDLPLDPGPSDAEFPALPDMQPKSGAAAEIRGERVPPHATREPYPARAEFVDWTLPEHGCRVYMPGDVFRESMSIDMGSGQLRIATYKAKFQGATYVFKVIDHPSAMVAGRTAEAILDEYRGDVVDEPHGRLVDSKMMQACGMPANDFQHQHPANGSSGNAYNRAMVKGPRLFHLAILGADVPSAFRHIFFQSVELLEGTEIPPANHASGDSPQGEAAPAAAQGGDSFEPLPLPATDRLTLSEDARQLFASHPELNQISVIDVEKRELIKTISTPAPSALLSRGDRLIVANRGMGTVSVYSRANDWQLESSAPVGDPNPEYLSAPAGKYYRDVVAIRSKGNGRDQCPVTIVHLKRKTGFPFSNGRTMGCAVDYTGQVMIQQSLSGSPNRYVEGVYSFASLASGRPSRKLGEHIDSFPLLYQVGATPYWFGARQLFVDMPLKTLREAPTLIVPDYVVDTCYLFSPNTVTCVALNSTLDLTGTRELALPSRLRDSTEIGPLHVAATIGDLLHLFILGDDGVVYTSRMAAFEIPPAQARTDRAATVAKARAERAAPAGTPKAPVTRTWQDASGMFRIEATLVAVEGNMVKLKRTDGMEIQVPLEKLSDTDRAFVRGTN